jgi:hypothetical protein
METQKRTPAKRGRKAKIEKPEILIRSLTLTPATVETLEQLSRDASDYIGRTVSSSAIMRALLQYAKQQGDFWARDQLFPFVEEELDLGVIWGKKR